MTFVPPAVVASVTTFPRAGVALLIIILVLFIVAVLLANRLAGRASVSGQTGDTPALVPASDGAVDDSVAGERELYDI